MKPGSTVQIIYTGKTGVVVANKGETVIIKETGTGRILYLKTNDVRVPNGS